MNLICNSNWIVILITLTSFFVLFLSETKFETTTTIPVQKEYKFLYEAKPKKKDSNFKIFFSVPNLIQRNKPIKMKVNVISVEYDVQNKIELKFLDFSRKFFFNESFDIPKIGNNIEFNVTLKPQLNLKFENIPKSFLISLKYKKLEEDFEVKVRMEWFPLSLNYDHFKNNVHCLVRNLNIILFGIPGVGKSSFVNTQMTSVSNQIMENAASMDIDESLTQEYQLHRLEHGNQNTLNLIDTFGLDETNYHSDIERCSLNGTLKSFTLNDAKKYVSNPNSTLCYRNETKLDKIKLIQEKMHSVIIPLTVDQITNADDKLNKIMSESVYIAAQMKYNPIVLISWRTKDFFNQTRHTMIKELAHKFTGVNMNKIFIFFAYSNETKKDFLIDQNAAIIREKIFDLMTSFLIGQKDIYAIPNEAILCKNMERSKYVVYMFEFMERFRAWVNPVIRILSLMRY
eukprot:gene11775-5113_t